MRIAWLQSLRAIFASEKQFRFPLEYANQRPVSATWTVTGGGAFILSKDAKQPLAKVAGVTTGKIDYGIKRFHEYGSCDGTGCR